MNSSAEVALLFRVSELARRFGMKPSDAEAFLDFIEIEADASAHFRLMFAGGRIEKSESFDRMMRALGCPSNGVLIAEDLSTLEDIVEQALSLAPRPRSL